MCSYWLFLICYQEHLKYFINKFLQEIMVQPEILFSDLSPDGNSFQQTRVCVQSFEVSCDVNWDIYFQSETEIVQEYPDAIAEYGPHFDDDFISQVLKTDIEMKEEVPIGNSHILECEVALSNKPMR